MPATDKLILRMARPRPHGSVDTATTPIEASTRVLAIAAAAHAMDRFLDGSPGIGILTDATGPVWSERRGMARPFAPSPLGM